MPASDGNGLSRELHDLEQDFAALAGELGDSPEKRAISLLHGMILETWRQRAGDGAGARMADPASPIPAGCPDIADLYRSAPAMEAQAVNRPLPTGSAAPDFALRDPSGELVRLADFRGRPVVVVFYPLDWSPGCSQQLDLYQQELDEFHARGIELVAISVDSLYSHGAWAAVRGITFPLLADFHPKGQTAREYSVWREDDGFSERALYVVDADGTIAYAHVSPYVHHVPDIYELFDALDHIVGAPV